MEHSLPAVTLMTKFFFRTVAQDRIVHVPDGPWNVKVQQFSDLNCIENLIHLLNKKLQTDTIDNNIEKETFEEFSEKEENTMRNFNVETIDKIMGTMAKRVTEVIKNKGPRIKY